MKIKQKEISGRALLITAVIVVPAVVFGVRALYRALCYDSTDDAQIDGNIIPLRTMVSGYVKEVRIVDNQRVKRGDTLVVLDTVDLSAKVRQAEAQLSAARNNLSLSLEQMIASRYSHSAASFSAGSAREEIDAARAKVVNEERNFGRVSRMFAGGAATQQSYDQAKAAFDIARAQLSAAENQYESANARGRNLKTAISVTKLQSGVELAHVREAEMQLKQAVYLFSHAFIISPCDGIISRKEVERGQFLPAATAMASVIDLKDLWVTADFKETQITGMKIGQSVVIQVDAYPGFKIKGRVESFCAATGAKFSLLPAQNATGNFIKVTQRIPVRISISQSCDGDSRLILPGMSVTASVKTR